jgi:hypothetical protein
MQYLSVIEHVENCLELQDLPSNSASPDMRRRSSDQISPDLAFRNIEVMRRQAVGTLAFYHGSMVNEVEMQRNIVPCGKSVGLSRIEDVYRVDAIKPHLLEIGQFVENRFSSVMVYTNLV